MGLNRTALIVFATVVAVLVIIAGTVGDKTKVGGRTYSEGEAVAVGSIYVTVRDFTCVDGDSLQVCSATALLENPTSESDGFDQDDFHLFNTEGQAFGQIDQNDFPARILPPGESRTLTLSFSMLKEWIPGWISVYAYGTTDEVKITV